MSTPNLSEPILLTPKDLKADAGLTAQITTLANNAFLRCREPEQEKWDNSVVRFPKTDLYFDMLGDNGFATVIFDRDVKVDGAEGKLIACAAATPWKGGWMKEGAGREKGWEVKAICVDGDARYSKRGLAVKLLAFLEDCLIQQERRVLLENTNGISGEGDKSGLGKDTLVLWILAAECINGVYWRKRGYQEVRRHTAELGTWGCKKSFDMVVFKKDVEFDIEHISKHS